MRLTNDPSAVLDDQVDWSKWLAAGETTAAPLCTVPAALTRNSDAQADTMGTVWLSGGQLDAVHAVINRITTIQGGQDERQAPQPTPPSPEPHPVTTRVGDLRHAEICRERARRT
ncbi:hypothetical protein [Terrabacter sp. NPDC000476]|uniref:phage fiber-tail adaptor protein n=1 Tax=Terrabacter sp. NPDC000476 TaxID=3154258 RepID=UPI00331C1423